MSDAPAADLAARPMFQRLRLFGLLALLVAVPLSLLAVAAFTNAEREFRAAERAALESASLIARQAAARLDEYYDEIDQFLAAVGEASRGVLTRGEDGNPPLKRMLAAMPPHVNGLSIIVADGRMVTNTNLGAEELVNVSIADRPYFKAAMAKRGLVVSEPVLARTNQVWVSVSARPVLDDKNTPIGMVLAALRIDRFHHVLVPRGLPQDALMTVFNERGIGISSTAEPLAAVGRDFTAAPAVRRALQERTFAAQIASSDGQQRLTAYTVGERLPWVVEVGLPIEATLASAKERRTQRLTYLFAALLVGLAIAYWLAQWIARPLRAMTRDAGKLGGGDLGVRTSARGYYEVQRLGSAFNTMAEALASKQRELEERMDLFRITLETAPVAIGLVRRRDNAVLLANSAGYSMFNVDPQAGQWDVIANWERREDLAAMLQQIKADGHVRDREAPIRVPGRSRLWALLSAQPARYAGEDVLVVTVNDITARKQLETQREGLLADLHEANERLSRLSRQVLDAQEAERRQIAHELHDEIGQNLTALKLFAGHLRGRVAADAQQEISEWVAVLDRAIEQVRDLSRILRPVQLDHMGLTSALRALLDTQARAAGWSVDFAADADMARTGTHLETVAYRVAQEALSNAARHADAARVSLEVKIAGGRLTLALADDGRGFDPDVVRKRVQEGHSMGLLGMEERVRLAGGTFELESAPTRGTRIRVTLPVAVEQTPA